ncbi:MAG: hypothetical protein ACREIA_01805 [Opitutaceae bacterium]
MRKVNTGKAYIEHVCEPVLDVVRNAPRVSQLEIALAASEMAGDNARAFRRQRHYGRALTWIRCSIRLLNEAITIEEQIEQETILASFGRDARAGLLTADVAVPSPANPQPTPNSRNLSPNTP